MHYNGEKAKLKTLCEVQAISNDIFKRSIVISKFIDGDGYKIGVKEVKTNLNGDFVIEYKKGAVIVPDREKLIEFAYVLLDIADE